MNKRKICVVTGTRAEYGLLYWLMKEIEADEDLQLQLIVTGMHLCEEFGNTYKEVEKEFYIDKKVDIELSDDTPVCICKSMGIAQSSFAQTFDALKPDIIVILGDRFEMFAVASSAMILNIPIAHLHGGESTQGLIDESIRHCITKMSHLHFTATDEYKNRVIQLGEQPKTVYNVGGLGLDNIKKLKLLDKKEFEESIDFKLNSKNFLVTFHPVTLEENSSKEQFENLLASLNSLEDTHIIFTKANSDTNGRIINQLIEEYVDLNKEKAIVFASLGQLRYLSALQFMDGMVGNSSSGLIETPSFKIGTIDIGDRQKGRIKASSVIECGATKKEITEAFEKLYSQDFQLALKNTKNPYGNGGASRKINKVIKDINLKGILKKEFYNIKDIS